MKKLLSLAICLMMAFLLCSCNNTTNTPDTDSSFENSQSESNSENSTSSTSNTASTSSSEGSFIKEVEAPIPFTAPSGNVTPVKKANPKIFLAGDSTVKTYGDKQYIGGWGQYLQNFLNAENVTVVNKSEGGRSSRSFINEGRLFAVEGSTRTSIESEITNGDYLFIQFGHNDDETRGSLDTYIDRQVQLGTPDANGIFPTEIPTQQVSKYHLPQKYLDQYKDNKTEINAAYSKASAYGTHYFAADQGTFKGYLKIYIDFARSKGAIPVLCTPVARVKFDSSFNLLGGAGRHGPNFEYVEAVRQLAKEEDCLLIDLFDFTKTMLETTAKTAQNIEEANYLMALKPNAFTGEWPKGYDDTYKNSAAGYKGIEATHYNKYGAYLTAAKVAEELIKLGQANTTTSHSENVNFTDSILTTPTTKIVPSGKMQATTVQALNGLFTLVTVS